ncbi:MAG: hypothetical protein H6672_09610 [Anaerolineaceae bacterium]|nr:hypothetical protein [Anaerolineaceae bacterium]
MSKRTKRPKAKSAKVPAKSLVVRAVEWIVRLPRLVRIIMVGVFAIAVTFAVSPVVDELYLRWLFDDSTVILPSIITVVIGMVVYIIGWLLVVGSAGETPRARPVVLLYCLLGILAVVLAVAALLPGLNGENFSIS